MESPKTRINASMLPKHAGQYVCVVGRNLGVSCIGYGNDWSLPGVLCW